MSDKKKPAHEIRMGGIKAAVWENPCPTGVRYNVTLCKVYKDGEQWRTTESFGRDDLLVAAKVADHAHSWICERRRSA